MFLWFRIIMPRFSANFPTNNQISNNFALTSHTHGKAEFFKFENLSVVGEITIYNRDELKKDLNSDSNSDGELFLQIYAKYGIQRL